MKIVKDNAEFKEIISKPTLTVVDYFATWYIVIFHKIYVIGWKLTVDAFAINRCGPCVKIAPFFESLAVKYPDVVFIKVDVDQGEEIAAERGIEAMPTFHFYRAGQLLETLQGADANRIEQLVIQNKQVSLLKNPSEMTIKELKAAIVNSGLASKATGMIEKQEFINLLNQHFNL